MGHGLIIVKKTLDGEEFSNTYAFWNEDGTVQLGENDLEAVGATVAITDTNTTASAVQADLLHSVIAFDRALTHTTISYSEVYITDGTRNETDPSNVFFTAALAFQGLWVNTAPAPGNTTLLIQRVPSGFSARKGRLYMRGAISEAEVRLGGDRLITWESSTARQNVIDRVAAALTSSELDNYTNSGGGLGTTWFTIPHYTESVGSNGKIIRNLTGGTIVQTLVASRPNARQVQKGRKRSSDA